MKTLHYDTLKDEQLAVLMGGTGSHDVPIDDDEEPPPELAIHDLDSEIST